MPLRFAQYPLVISFSGIDGAGKSTQIELLRKHLQHAGHTVNLITFWDDVAVLKNLREAAGQKVFRGDPGVGSPEAPIERKDKNVRSPAMTLVRLGLYLLDAWSLRRVVRRARRSKMEVVIFDRYLFDELANLELGSSMARLYTRALLRLSGRPDVGFILDADPEQARARKPEYPLEFLRSNRQAYLNLSVLLGGIDVLNPATVSVVAAQIACRVESAAAAYQ